MKNAKLLYKIFEFCFIALFLLIIVLIVFFNEVFYFDFEVYQLFLSGFLGLALLFGAYSLIKKIPSFSVKHEIILISSLLLLYLAFQLFIGWNIRVSTEPKWDFGVVYTYAENYVIDGTLPDEYFNNFSGNSGNATIYLFFVALFSFLQLFGVADFLPYAIVVNAIFINLSLTLLYLTARRLVGFNGALFSLFLSFCTLAFIGYVPIIYSDTLSLPFAILGVFFYIKARESFQKGDNKAILYYLLCILSIAVGYGIKQTVIILFVAIIIDVLIQKFSIKQLVTAVISIVLIVALTEMSKAVVFSNNALPEYDEDARLPLTHWVMMGLYELGGYNDDDVQYTLSFDTYEEKQEANIAEIENRLNEMGFAGFWEHIAKKLSFTYGDGTYTATVKLDRGPLEQNLLHGFIIWSSDNFRYFALCTFGILVGTLFWVAASAFSALKTDDYSTTFLRVAIFGLTIFLLIFETRTRYLVNYLPIFILCATCGVSNFRYRKMDTKT